MFDASQWDGSDVFMIWPLPKFLFVTERVAQILTACQVSGVELVPIQELQMGNDGLAPGRLSYIMPENRAAAFGKSLDIY
jgi:hypothetical protein